MRLEKILCTVLQEAYERLDEETIYFFSLLRSGGTVYTPTMNSCARIPNPVMTSSCGSSWLPGHHP